MNVSNHAVVVIPHGLGKCFRRRMDWQYAGWRVRVQVHGDRGFPARGNPGYETLYMPTELVRYLGWWFRFRRWVWKVRFCKYTWWEIGRAHYS